MAEIVVKLVNGELAGKTIQNITKEVAANTLAFKKATVGTQEWVNANKKMEDSKKLLADVKKQTEGVTDASNFLKAAWNKLPGAQYFNQVGESFGIMKKGVGGLVSQFGMLKTAVAATGIGLLVIAFATLYGWFTKTDEGATLLSGILKGFGIVVDTVFGKLIDMAKGIGEFFTGKKSIKQGLKDLVEFIGTNLINRLKSFVVIWQGIKNLDLKKVTDGFIQLGTGVTDATDKMAAFGKSVAAAVKEGVDLEAQLDAIEDRARELSVINAETEKEVSRLLLQSKNVGLSYEERIKLLDQASALELKSHAQQLANAQMLEKVRADEIEQNAKRNIQTDELDQALADAQIARINLEKESINLQEKIANRRTALIEKELAEKEKAAAELKKLQDKQMEDELKARDNLEALRIEKMTEGLAKEIATIQSDTTTKIEALVGSAQQIADQKALLEEIEGQRIQDVRDKYRKTEEDKAKEAAEKQRALADQMAQFNYDMEMMKLDLAQTTVDGLGDIIAEQIKNEKAATAIRKTTALIDIGINLQKELAANAAAASANPLNAVTFGAAGASQLALSNVLSITRAVLAAVKVKAFRKGGIPDGVLEGPSHEQGGIPLVAEGREIILSTGVYDNPGLRAAASALNVAGGGRSFAAGGPPINAFDRSRGPIPSGRAGTPTSDPLGTDRMIAALDRWGESMNSRIDRIKVTNNLQEVRKGINTINEILDQKDV